jgi:hypothetical protein
MEGFYVILGLGLRVEVPTLSTSLRAGFLAKEMRSRTPSVVEAGGGVMGVGIFRRLRITQRISGIMTLQISQPGAAPPRDTLLTIN